MAARRDRPLPSGRFQARHADGRFRRNRIEDLGLHTIVCAHADPWCGAVNTWSLGEDQPARCHRCGTPLGPPAEADNGRHRSPRLPEEMA